MQQFRGLIQSPVHTFYWTSMVAHNFQDAMPRFLKKGKLAPNIYILSALTLCIPPVAVAVSNPFNQVYLSGDFTLNIQVFQSHGAPFSSLTSWFSC